ncbi:cysteine and histidine-rich domain-containing protein-like isoform X2 [Portunus trituberculatus]|uniref:cysteine and histidine-rich domain-containing protein-like isoform X2 n=1 Tax=Portunus trituberculatus TaxID=210409 RepID=UPI001E1D16CD|nr:cysteine and histidine-rich domain-containing protein-like isoform X2 [Portunus trituberculatus]
MSLVQCYNKGCGQKFKLEENSEDACEYHPGAPIFHDAYKGWSCCNKKSTDFTTFLNTKGCTKGKHNPEKPPEPEKRKVDPSTRDEALEKKAAEEKTDNSAEEGEMTESGIKIGENCKNNGCKSTYEGDHSNLDMCKHHPGYPVFHEGLKYWTCCQKKTTDFSEFLEQAGCSTGHHCWVKLDSKKVATCRYDWHQTPTHVCVAIYAKLCDPAITYVEVNPIRLNANIVFADANVFTLDVELRGIVDVQQSSVNLAATKVEIKLRKAEPSSWRTLIIEKALPSENKTDDEKAKCEELEQRVDAVDLSDL